MGAQQLSESVIVLEDKLTFQTAYVSGLALAAVAILVYLLVPDLTENQASYWFGALFIAGDVFFVLSARKIRITLDKEKRMMTVEKFSIVGMKKFEIPMSKITKIALKQDSKVKKMKLPVLLIYLDDRRVLKYDYVLDEEYDATVLSAFLGVPYEERELGPAKWQSFFGEKD